MKSLTPPSAALTISAKTIANIDTTCVEKSTVKSSHASCGRITTITAVYTLRNASVTTVEAVGNGASATPRNERATSLVMCTGTKNHHSRGLYSA